MSSSQSQQQKKFYDENFRTIAAPWMEANIRGFYFEKMAAILNDNGGIKAGSRFLEIGVGEGAVMEKMRAHFKDCRFHGVDISQKNVALARALGLDVEEADANNLKLSGGYDVIYGTAILHHLDDIPGFLANVARLLNPGGIILFGPEPVFYEFLHILYCKWRGCWEIEKGFMRLSAGAMRKYLQDGYRDVRIYRHGNPFVYFSKTLGVIWNATRLSRIFFLNDIYVYARKE